MDCAILSPHGLSCVLGQQSTTLEQDNMCPKKPDVDICIELWVPHSASEQVVWLVSIKFDRRMENCLSVGLREEATNDIYIMIYSTWQICILKGQTQRMIRMMRYCHGGICANVVRLNSSTTLDNAVGLHPKILRFVPAKPCQCSHLWTHRFYSILIAMTYDVSQ